jgi:hypothetical protein
MQAIQRYRWFTHFIQFAVAHALGFPVLTSRLLATGLNTEIITVSLDYTLQVLHINKVFKSHFRSSTNFPWLLSPENWLTQDKSQRRSVGQSVLVSSSHQGLTTRFLLLSDSCSFVDAGRSLWRENGSAVYNCCWSSPAQSFLGSNPAGLVTIFYCLRFETPSTWRTTPYLYPPGTGWPSYTSRHWVQCRRLLRLSGLRWRYSNPPPRGVTPSHSTD